MYDTVVLFVFVCCQHVCFKLMSRPMIELLTAARKQLSVFQGTLKHITDVELPSFTLVAMMMLLPHCRRLLNYRERVVRTWLLYGVADVHLIVTDFCFTIAIGVESKRPRMKCLTFA